MGVMGVPLGYNRTYAKLLGPLTEENYLRALLNGRSFATSGPMLFLTVDDKEPGFMFRLSGDSKHQPLTLKAELQSIDPIDCLEIVQNGQVIKRTELKGDKPAPALKKVLKIRYWKR